MYFFRFIYLSTFSLFCKRKMLIELNGYKQGPYLSYSRDGKYLLLLQQFFTDWSLNQDRPSRVEVMEAATGRILLSKDRVHSAAFTPDSKSLLTLIGNEVVFWDV